MRYLLSCMVVFAVVCVPVNAQQAIQILKQDSNTFLSCDDLAKSLDMKFEVVRKGVLATFCSNGADALCVPVPLKISNHRIVEAKTYLLLADAQSLLSISVSVKGSTAYAVTLPSNAPTSATSPGYNAPWPVGRGFDVGQTVPDIPVVDMDGNEVRFSEYLGKRYILYCWASW